MERPKESEHSEVKELNLLLDPVRPTVSPSVLALVSTGAGSLRRSCWTSWRRGGGALTSASPFAPSALTLTETPPPAPRPSSTRWCWSLSTCTTWHKRLDGWTDRQTDSQRESQFVIIRFISAVLPQVAKETGLSVDEVKEDARSILEEMSQNLQLSFIRLMSYVLTKVFKRLFSGIFVNVDGLNSVRTANQTEI